MGILIIKIKGKSRWLALSFVKIMEISTGFILLFSSKNGKVLDLGRENI